MKAKISGAVLYFLLSCFSVSACLLGQSSINLRDDKNPEATLSFEGLEDVAGFIAARRVVIAEKVDILFREFENTKRAPEGVSAQAGQSSILISGRHHPELFDHTAALVLFVDRYQSSMRDVCVGGLIARGFRLNDLDILSAAFDEPGDPHTVFHEIRKTAEMAIPQPDKNRTTDEEIRHFLETRRQSMANALDAWAADRLQKLPLRARRILLSYIYEKIIPKSHVTQWLPVTETDILYFRNPDEATP